MTAGTPGRRRAAGGGATSRSPSTSLPRGMGAPFRHAPAPADAQRPDALRLRLPASRLVGGRRRDDRRQACRRGRRPRSPEGPGLDRTARPTQPKRRVPQSRVGRSRSNPLLVAASAVLLALQVQLSVRRGREAVGPYRAVFGAEEVNRFGGTERPLLVVDDPSQVVARAVGLGARGVSPVLEEHGWLLGRFADPFGHRWEIGPVLVYPDVPAVVAFLAAAFSFIEGTRIGQDDRAQMAVGADGAVIAAGAGTARRAPGPAVTTTWSGCGAMTSAPRSPAPRPRPRRARGTRRPALRRARRHPRGPWR